MAIKRKTKSKKQILPNALHSFIARRIIDSAGLAILIFGSFIIIALLTYSHADPSVNTALSETQSTQNAAGAFGSNVSDILAQSFGFGALVLGLLPIIWGLRLFKRKPINNIALRITAYLFATISLSIGLTLFPSETYLDQPYLGGSAGMLITNAISGALPSNIAAFAHTAIPLVFLCCAALMAAIATGLQKSEWLHIYHRATGALIYGLQMILYVVNAFKYWLQKHGAFEQSESQSP